MRTIAIIIAALVSITATHAQAKTEKHISFSGKESVDLNIQIADSIDIQTWQKNEVYVTASVKINDNKDNDAYQISFAESGDVVGIKANFKKDYFKDRDDCCNESEIYWQVFIPERTPFFLETINGNVTIVGRTDEMKVKSISGFIDLAVPQTIKADLELSTITGTVYTNHDLTADQDYKTGPSVIKEKLNDGGTPITLGTISGDIFLRKTN